MSLIYKVASISRPDWALIYEKQKPFDNEAEPTIIVFVLLLLPPIPFDPILSSSFFFSSSTRNPQRQWDLWSTKTDISVVGTIVRGLTIDPEKEISSSHEVHPFYFSSPSFFVTQPLFSVASSLPLALLFLAFLFTAANNSFCDVISLRLCSFADTPVLYSIPGDSLPSLYARHVSLLLAIFSSAASGCLSASLRLPIFSAIIRDSLFLSLARRQKTVSVARFNRYSAVPAEIERFVV